MEREFFNSPLSSKKREFFARIRSLPRTALLGGIGVYRKFVSPLFPPSCRYYPTCSEYAREAVEKYGPMKGSWMSLKRILRCHPFHPGGYDPLP